MTTDTRFLYDALHREITSGVMKFIAAVFLLLSTPALSAQCLSYSGEVTLRGLLSKRTFAEQPNYESIAKGDRAATYFFIAFQAPICVAEGQANNDEPAESGIKSIQLAFPLGKDSYAPLRPYLGKAVECRGSLYHAMSGHHHSRVLLGDAKCRAAP